MSNKDNVLMFPGATGPREIPTGEELDAAAIFIFDAVPLERTEVGGVAILPAEVRLLKRMARLRRLMDMKAPDIIIRHEEGMVMQMIAACMGLDGEERDRFKLPSYDESQEGM